jgi:hypothetical protein
MNFYELRFCKRSAFVRAFSDVVACPYVEDCLVDACSLSLRFRAVAEPAVQQLIDRIQLDGDVQASITDPPGTDSSSSSTPL